MRVKGLLLPLLQRRWLIVIAVLIDGKEAWRVDVHGKQLDIPPPSKALGSLGKSLMELLGFKTRKWF